MHGGVDNRFNDSSTAKVVFFFETNGFSTHKCAKITLLSFSGTPPPVFLRIEPPTAFKRLSAPSKSGELCRKRPLLCRQNGLFFAQERGNIRHEKAEKKYPREKMHHVLAQPRAKRHTPTWTNVPEACTTDSIIYRKINSTTKGTSYPQKEPSPLGWAISPKKKEARAKKNKNDRFSTRSRGCGAAEPTTQAPPLGGGRKEEQRGGKEQNGGKKIDNHIKNERNARHVLRKP